MISRSTTCSRASGGGPAGCSRCCTAWPRRGRGSSRPRPGGVLGHDTLNATELSRGRAVTLDERVRPAVAGMHDPELFVDPRILVDECARHGVRLAVRGLRPAALDLARWLATRRGAVA